MAQTELRRARRGAAAVGRDLGTSDWLEITQERVDQFADATGDHQWIHVDPERAAAGPFGGTIAHGYLTLSLSNALLPEIVEVRGVSMGVNYGANKVRFPAPVPVGSRIRAQVDAGGGRGGGRRPADDHGHHHRDRGRHQAGLRHRVPQPLPRLNRPIGTRRARSDGRQCTLGAAMDLRFTPEEDAFRKEVRAYLDDLLHGEFAVDPGPRRAGRRARVLRRAPGLGAAARRRRLDLRRLADRVRRPRPAARPAGHLLRGVRPRRRARAGSATSARA